MVSDFGRLIRVGWVDYLGVQSQIILDIQVSPQLGVQSQIMTKNWQIRVSINFVSVDV